MFSNWEIKKPIQSKMDSPKIHSVGCVPCGLRVNFTFYFIIGRSMACVLSSQNSLGSNFTGPAFTKHLKALFFKLSGVEISVNALRSAFVTYVNSQE